MRLKGFIIFIIIFTIVYIGFFIIYDKMSLIREENRIKKMLDSLINIDNYLKFALFYGVNGTVSKDTIIQIYDEIKNRDSFRISLEAMTFNLSKEELVTIVIYLEYLELIPVRNISLSNDVVRSITFTERDIVNKYHVFFQEKRDLDFISTNIGNSVTKDLDIITSENLVPGVVYKNSRIYYVGDVL